MDENDPLASLVVDAVELDRQRIAEALSGVVYLDRAGRIVPADGFPALPNAEKLLAVLLGRKAAVLLELADVEAAAPSVLVSETGLPDGSVRPTLRRLYDNRLVSQDVDNAYYLSPHQVGTAIDRLSASRGGDSDDEGSGAPTTERVRRPVAKQNRKRRAGKRKTSTSGNGDGEGATRKASTAFSVTAAVHELIEQGFFESPKTLGDVRRNLKDKQGRDVPTTTLSPIFTRLLRSGDLDRAKNDDGAYEYTATS